MTVKRNLISSLRRVNWDFPSEASQSPFSRLHPHPGRFASQIAHVLISALSERGGLVLDPFAGSGTTLVEAQALGRESIGIDLNPISILACRAKTLPYQYESLRAHIQRIGDESAERLTFLSGRRNSEAGAAAAPATVQRKWYSKETLRHLAELWLLVAAYRGVRGVIARACFSSILLKCCNETRSWGYVCDNTRPLGERHVNVGAVFRAALGALLEAYRYRADTLMAAGVQSIPKAECVEASSKVALRKVPSGTVDVVLTSPPYFGVHDYIKSQRLSLEWFGLNIEPLRQDEIGARSKRHRASALADFVDDLSVVLDGVHRCLRPGGTLAMIVGESSTRRGSLDQIFRAVAKSGLSIQFEASRRISDRRRQNPSLTSERVVVATK